MVRTVVVLVEALVASAGVIEVRTVVVGAPWPLPLRALATSTSARATGMRTVRRALMG
ncbi:MAG: hypothetical protein M0005_12750 [Actinomycetota bacterium]|nr:hypothetical protein [Actinomycetota bacterium]